MHQFGCDKVAGAAAAAGLAAVRQHGWLQQLLQCWAAEVQLRDCEMQQAAAAADPDGAAAAAGGSSRAIGGHLTG
uniref:Uncharacterized protein n=1 Tax=Tetradesmus obliquus TaxID=3088 RepID=A0A383V6Y9_TETOB|eukprot:jgi/Sobl393_1/6478/SZX61368.1